MWFWFSFLLLGAVLYLPIGVTVWTLMISDHIKNKYSPETSKQIANIFAILSFGIAILVHGGFFGWYEKIEKPDEIVITTEEVKNDFYKYEEAEGIIYITISDKNFSENNESHLTNNGKIRFNVKSENAEKKQANLEWIIEIGDEKYERNSLPAAIETHIFDSDFSLKYGETTAKITAKNKLGEISKTVIITKLNTEKECAKSENAKIDLCKKLIAANQADAEKEAERIQNIVPTPAYGYEKDTTFNGTANTIGCSYERYGKCWDDVIEQAENDAWSDAYMYGDDFKSYMNYRGCEGVCADIYDDAYWDARDDARDMYR